MLSCGGGVGRWGMQVTCLTQRFVLHNAVEAKKKYMLCYHNEKLAIGFGFIFAPWKTACCHQKTLGVLCLLCCVSPSLSPSVADLKIIVGDGKRL
eukprot:c48958_g1_i1 orf=195-479(+)